MEQKALNLNTGKEVYIEEIDIANLNDFVSSNKPILMVVELYRFDN